MEEIEVGEYVRNRDGEIHKIIKINNPDDEVYRYYIYENNMGDCKEDIVKHSKNIIKLLKLGDFVNESIIIEINYEQNWLKTLLLDEYGEPRVKMLLEKDIKTILTHEQYEANCYKLEG